MISIVLAAPCIVESSGSWIIGNGRWWHRAKLTNLPVWALNIVVSPVNIFTCSSSLGIENPAVYCPNILTARSVPYLIARGKRQSRPCEITPTSPPCSPRSENPHIITECVESHQRTPLCWRCPAFKPIYFPILSSSPNWPKITVPVGRDFCRCKIRQIDGLLITKTYPSSPVC